MQPHVGHSSVVSGLWASAAWNGPATVRITLLRPRRPPRAVASTPPDVPRRR
jgi:hypothetical protein